MEPWEKWQPSRQGGIVTQAPRRGLSRGRGRGLVSLQDAPSMDVAGGLPPHRHPEAGVASWRGSPAAALCIRTFFPLPADKGIHLTEQLRGQGSFWSGEIARKQLLP